MRNDSQLLSRATLQVDVLSSAVNARSGSMPCIFNENVTFTTQALESFASRNWNATVYDALVVAAAVEFCDRSRARKAYQWGRDFDLRVEVHNPDLWSSRNVYPFLVDTLNFLTGDNWKVEFVGRSRPADAPRQVLLEFPLNAEAVIAYSDGMDSRAVAGLERQKRGPKLVLVRLGGSAYGMSRAERAKRPFRSVPYKVKIEGDNEENSARSRGFKFAMVAAIAAYLVDAPIIIIPESGQGALGPALLPVGQAYPDYRNHPAFTKHMQRLIEGLLGHKLRYEFPRLWNTKAQTLKAFAAQVKDSEEWISTRSCWQQSRQVSIGEHRRQCGICAACMLRRLSVHAADLVEPSSNYIWESLSASDFADGANAGFEASRITPALREYAIAGVLHLDHLAELRRSEEYGLVKGRFLNQLAHALDQSPAEIMNKMDGMLSQHELEWSAFVSSIGKQSFINAWLSSRS
ncbi:7-cyano-7-deazaguanine synthase [Mesorhizobium sp. LSJC285A00]|uniref:7-cyano-7-deazaguanine synthase n=1 Tax=Mesorhizobium sp. LSJC285A00 TaxID=1287338 RepID=UPI000419C575|nr:7-cyano-7-deazaguanine synthase [Mesorhizobium sp. LSJC285A00]